MGKMVRNIFVMFLLLLFVSCVNKGSDNIVSLLKEWEHKEIVFPKKMYFTIMLEDTILYDYRSEYKILTYIDSIGCTSCKLQLPAWKMLIEEMDSLYTDKVKFIFVFSPHRIQDINYAMLAANFKYPVSVDTHDSFASLNRFPSDTKFHTLLLDKNNKVIVIGNPVYNPKIKELYMKVVSNNEFISQAEVNLETTAIFNKQSLDIGCFAWQDEQYVGIEISNTGKAPLVINDVITSCGCTTVEYPKKPVQSGKSLTLKVKYQAEHPEHFNKTITVYCNAEGSPFHLKISGNAK